MPGARLDPKIINEISQRLQAGETLWRIIDDYDLPLEQKLELLRLFDDQKWD